jgi:hypothetical protein
LSPSREAIAIADAWAQNVGLPTYTQLARALRMLDSSLIPARLTALLIDAEVEALFERAGIQL